MNRKDFRSQKEYVQYILDTFYKKNIPWVPENNTIFKSVVREITRLARKDLADRQRPGNYKNIINERTIDLNFIDTSNITDMSKLFVHNYRTFETSIIGYDSVDVSSWNVSNVTNMEEIFKNSNIVPTDLSKWDVSNVKNMAWALAWNSFNGDISNWDVSRVEDMDSMFRDSKFNGDISNWDVSNVKNMEFMFNGSDFNGDISSWDVSNVENMGCMFLGTKFDRDISNWDTSNVKDMTWMFPSGYKSNPGWPDWYIEYEKNKKQNKRTAENFNRSSLINKLEERDQFSRDIRRMLNN